MLQRMLASYIGFKLIWFLPKNHNIVAIGNFIQLVRFRSFLDGNE